MRFLCFPRTAHKSRNSKVHTLPQTKWMVFILDDPQQSLPHYPQQSPDQVLDALEQTSKELGRSGSTDSKPKPPKPGRGDIAPPPQQQRDSRLPKRDSTKMHMDKSMFKSFDTNGDGYVSMEELDQNIKLIGQRRLLPEPHGPWARRPWLQGTPSKCSNEKLANWLCPASARLSPRALCDARIKWREAQVRSWVMTHCPAMVISAKAKKNIPPERLEVLRRAFDLMDADGSGRIDFKEMAASMRALGFNDSEIRQTIKSGDVDGDGELDFNEYLRLIDISARSSTSSNPERDSFPFALVAESIRISRLVDSYSPAIREALPPFPQPVRPPVIGRAKSSKIDLDEGPNAPPIQQQIAAALRQNAARVLDLFRQWDADGDGEVSKKEFRKAMPAIGLDVSVQEVDALFDSWDQDGGGVLNFKELSKVLRSPPPPPAIAAVAIAAVATTRPTRGLGVTTPRLGVTVAEPASPRSPPATSHGRRPRPQGGGHPARILSSR